MAQAARKLQREIENVLKKVDDGIVEFERLWEKVYSADTASQKEKYEGELKGQIKKLQRLRESVKNWVSQGVLRDPHRLKEARHRVEQCMERFKVCERETKMKEYSKEALNAYRKKDPLDARKYKAKEWIDRHRRELEDQLEEYEDELTSLMGRSGRRRNPRQDRIEELERWVERHKSHISSLRKLWDRLRKNAADLDVVESLEEEVEYYVENHQDDDFYEDEALYERLDECDPVIEDEDVHVDDLDDEIVEKLGLTKESELREQQEREAAEAAERERKERERLEKERQEREVKERLERERVERERQEKERKLLEEAERRAAEKRRQLKEQQQQRPSVSFAAVISGAKRTTPKHSPMQSPVTGEGAHSPLQRPQQEVRPRGHTQQPVTQTPTHQPHSVPQAQASPVPQAQATDVAEQEAQAALQQQLALEERQRLAQLQTRPPLGPHGQVSALSAEQAAECEQRLRGLAVSLAHFPFPMETEFPAMARTAVGTPGLDDLPARPLAQDEPQLLAHCINSDYVPRNPCATPACFPREPLPLQQVQPSPAALFQTLDTDTLFFAFYFQQGAYAQYLAARALKKTHQWRYHQQYLTWFQRAQEPSETTEEYEQGNYIYFDYENWCQRMKKDFQFHYDYLEDDV